MASDPDSAAHTAQDRTARLRAIPSVDKILARARIAQLVEKHGHAVVTEAVRTVLDGTRKNLDAEAVDRGANALSIYAISPASLEKRIISEIETAVAVSLVRIINATGVVLHTNLGRAPLTAAAVEHLATVATGYSNLEYDLSTGHRGKRDVHTARLLAELAGAEAAVVVNNNAAAVFLVLNTLAKAAEVIVSRGELIEIGDGFRIPEIMSESGAILREVGTTNRTRVSDYERAANERTRLLLRVHPSNFRITGFTERPSLEDLVAVGQRLQIPIYEDLGSGCLADLAAAGVSEPIARHSFDAGVGVVSFSGDKLLGGPQAGIIAGKKEIVERIRRNPLFRALRVDKLTIGVLEMVLRSYQRGALDEIPALRMIRTPFGEIQQRAAAFLARINPGLPSHARAEIRDGFSVIGGGSTPDQQLPTRLVALTSRSHSAAAIEERLRRPEVAADGAQSASHQAIPVIARIEEDSVVLDLRTVLPVEEAALAAAVVAALQ